MTPEEVKTTISVLDALPDDTLVHYYKCASSADKPAEKKMLAPLKTAIEKERRKRGTASQISSKIVQPSAKPTKSGEINPDDYEGVENEY